jgi:hypothetical protein
MITKSVFEQEIIAEFQKELKKQAFPKSQTPNLVQAAECLHASLEIFENAGFSKQANQVLKLLEKIAKGDKHLKGLTPKKQVENLKDHGTQFNLNNDVGYVFEVPASTDNLTADDMEADFADLLNIDSFDFNSSDDEMFNLEIDDSLEAFDKDVPLDFEDERD